MAAKPRESLGQTDGALPCLKYNNSIESPPDAPEAASDDTSKPVVSIQHLKSSIALTWNVKALAERYGIERLGFLTLTFADDVQDAREAQRRFNSLASNVLRKRYAGYIRVVERQKSGRIHYHLLVVLPSDIRTGFDFKAIARHDYRSASRALRDEWDYWRATARKYEFGRTELLPIKSTDVAIARYVGKYISKHVAQRQERDKGIRLVEYSSGARMASCRFSVHTAGMAIWRLQLRLFATMVAEEHGLQNVQYEDMKTLLGPRWAWDNRHFIRELPVVFPEGSNLAGWIAWKMNEAEPREAMDGLPHMPVDE